MTLQLHGSARSSCSFRVRIALNLKGVEYFNTPLSVGVKSEEFLAINPQVAVLVMRKCSILEALDWILMRSCALAYFIYKVPL